MDIAGPPDMTREAFAQVLRAGNSPALPEAGAMYDALVATGVRPSIFLAFYFVESKLGTQGVVKQYGTRNPGNVRTPEDSALATGVIMTERGNFATYPSWTNGTLDWAKRLRGPKYEGAGLTTVETVLPKYAPSTDSNDPGRYAATVIDMVSKWAQESGMVEKPPLNTRYRSPNFGGYASSRMVEALCWHVTVGSAASSIGWLCNPNSNASANYLIDKAGTIYELVPPVESAWANGAVNKPDMTNLVIANWIHLPVNPNTRTISVEHERLQSANEQPHGFTEAQHQATVALGAWLCDRFAIPPDRTHIIRHAQIDSVNRQHCPGLAESEMVAWIGEIAALVGGGTQPEEEFDVQEPAAENIAVYVNTRGETILVANYGGVATDVLGGDVQDAGVSVRNAAGETYDRSVTANTFGAWRKRGT